MRFPLLFKDDCCRTFLVGLLAVLSGGTVRAGEPTAAAATERKDNHLLPTLLISVYTREPENLPTASIAIERLLYDLNHRRHLFSEVSADVPDTASDVRHLHLEIAMHRLGIEQANLHSLWPPITQRDPNGERVLFAGQLPVQVELVLADLNSGERYIKTAFTVQSNGRTITAGTTDTTGVLIARRIEKYLKEQRRSYANH